jgi:hypothetical protein
MQWCDILPAERFERLDDLRAPEVPRCRCDDAAPMDQDAISNTQSRHMAKENI